MSKEGRTKAICFVLLSLLVLYYYCIIKLRELNRRSTALPMRITPSEHLRVSRQTSTEPRGPFRDSKLTIFSLAFQLLFLGLLEIDIV